MYLSPQSEHLLDWFHVTMRLTVMGQLVKGMAVEQKAGDASPPSSTLTVVADLEKHLESLKWNLWHGNVFHALQRIEDIEDDIGMTRPSRRRLSNRQSITSSASVS